MRPVAAALGAITLLLLPVPAGAGDPCAVPDSILAVDAHLPRARERLATAALLPVLVVNTATPNPARTDASYPALLERELAARLPGRRVTVAVRNLPGATAQEMLPAMDLAVAEHTPALVVWQVGTMDAMRNAGLDGFGAALASGIAQTHARGADIVVMDMQYSPQTSQLMSFQPYVDYVEWVTQNNDVFHFPRYDIMRRWIEEGRVSIGSESKEDKLKAFTFVHGCVGRLLAQTITAMLDRAVEGGP